ncbi:MAG: 6-phosphogluconolactonase [Candidatus Glassbacteria bacterium]|nr:6-phosphogluconolactonase [Candidatus Glassbacteria bacterium]
MGKREIRVYDDKNSLSGASAELVCELAGAAVEDHGSFTLMLAGGSTPRTLYALLADEPFNARMPWIDTFLFWGDERFVPDDHPESNYRMARQAMIERVPVPDGNVFPVPTGDSADAAAAAQRYAGILTGFFAGNEIAAESEAWNIPRFDLILLGVGEDGHTASLFPGGVELKETVKPVTAVRAPAEYETTERVSVTLPVLNNAATVLFLAAGGGKRIVLDSVLNDPERAREIYPAAMVNPVDGRLIWFLDREADVGA